MTDHNKTIINSIRTLHDVSKAINSALDIDRVEKMILIKTSRLMGSDTVLILLLDEQNQSLTIHKSFGFEPSDLPSTRFEHIHSFDHCIVHKGSVITLDEVLSDQDRQLLTNSYPKLVKMIFAPLEIQGKAYGLLGVSRSENLFSEAELEIFCSLGSQAASAMENANLYKKLHTTFLHTAEALAEAVNSRDPYTGGHTQRVREYALQLADKFGLSDEEKESLRLAAILHDIGKIGIDDAILRKVDRLSAEEKRKMDDHPRIGAKILGFVEEMREVIPGVLHHHEWYDGSGYPEGLAGKQIPLQARIIAIVDAYDALTTDRPYRKASSAHEAHKILDMGSGTHFDPELLKMFGELLSRPRH